MDAFLENLARIGLEKFGRFYGIYRGIVVSNSDPNGRGRIQALCPAVGHKEGKAPKVWIDSAMNGAGADRGTFWPPEVDDSVWLAFQYGDPSLPGLYWGGWFGAPKGTNDVPDEFSKGANDPVRKRGFVTRGGHVLLFDDTPGKEVVRLSWHQAAGSSSDLSKSADRTQGKTGKIEFASDQSITIVDPSGNKVVISGGNITIHASSTVTIEGQDFQANTTTVELTKGADAPVPRGPDLLQWLSSHTHGSSMGPTSPPLAPPLPAILAQSTKVGH
jgi:uncharacterized protein involved in type VI secretion and phage assembly